MPMNKDFALPKWSNREFSDEMEDYISDLDSYLITSNDLHLFGGPIGEMLRLAKIPHSIEILYEMENDFSVARLAFEKPLPSKNFTIDGQNADETWRVIYCPFDIPSFAMLWNRSPDSINGIDANRITLHLSVAKERYPIILGADMIADLVFDGSRFLAEPAPASSLQDAISRIPPKYLKAA